MSDLWLSELLLHCFYFFFSCCQSAIYKFLSSSKVSLASPPHGIFSSLLALFSVQYLREIWVYGQSHRPWVSNLCVCITGNKGNGKGIKEGERILLIGSLKIYRKGKEFKRICPPSICLKGTIFSFFQKLGWDGGTER